MLTYTRLIKITYLIFITILLNQNCFGQSQLVQSFAEINNGGNNKFGYSVSGAGDVNNDGYDDVIVGDKDYSSTSTGRAYIYYGGSSIDNIADVTITGEETGNQFGCSVAGAGDVNNDGYDDVIVGDYKYNSSTGRVYIYYGGSSMDNTADVTMTGEAANHFFGHSVSGAGDVNNDGYDDVIVGAYGYSNNIGRVYIYYGSSSMDNTADLNPEWQEGNSRFGYSVSGAGDVNNDGYDDVIVGAYSFSSYTGRAYIWYGGGPMNEVVIMTGEAANHFFGHSVSGAGDVNNDGYDDVIVGAYGYNFETGRSYIYYGGSSMDNTADVRMTGEETGNQFGYSVSGAGDINNDGVDDVIVGAVYEYFTGRYCIYYGGSSMHINADITMTGEGTWDYFGYSVSRAGDVNNDGYDDVIVGAYKYPVNGKAYIFSLDRTLLIVNTTDDLDDGTCDELHCSLREAINAANSDPGPNEIYFNIPGSGPHTIQPLSPLSPITDPVIIDGYTQPGAVQATKENPATLLIELDGINVGDLHYDSGLNIVAGNSTVRGLVINRFGDAGIHISDQGGNVIEGNYIGTDVTGTVDRGNFDDGVRIWDSPDNTIGGSTPGARNIISGSNDNGVEILLSGATGNQILGNYIGTDVTGAQALGNPRNGVEIKEGANNNTIGAGNVISGNTGAGIKIDLANGNIVQSNFIGTNVNGSAVLGNGWIGVSIFESSNNTVGGTSQGEGNYICANGLHGILINQCGAGSNNIIQGNYIGTDLFRSNAIGNKGTGIVILNSEDVLIGGTDLGARNIISGNQGNGISIWGVGSKNNIVYGNIIGLCLTGTSRLGNKRGINIGYASNNIIGGSTLAKRNIISGNRYLGLGIIYNSATDNLIKGNYIGTDITGENAIGNGYDTPSPQGKGVAIYNAPNNQIGGTNLVNGNLISGNDGYGIWLAGAESKNNKILGNKIGTTAGGTEALPNTSDGVCMDWDEDDIPLGAANNTNIYLNRIAFNGGSGVSVKHGVKNKIAKNRIYRNDGLGIDLGGDGVTPNDWGDSDTGPNNLQNFPILANAYSEYIYDNSIPEINTNVDVYINSVPETVFSLQFFKKNGCDPSGFGEGKFHILNKDVTTDEIGDGLILALAINASSGNYITATARDPQNNTSEFSQCVLVSWLNSSSSTTVDPYETATSETNIPDGMSSTTFSSEWPGSDVVMTLITPSGRVITRTTSADDVDHENGPTSEYYTITDPEPGEWRVELFGADVPAGGEEVTLRVTVAPIEPIQTMVIDIKPDDENNSINCTNSNGVIPVAILTTEDFDATSIDHTTVRFGKFGTEAAETHFNEKKGEVQRHEEDVDNDGDIDLIFHFRYGETKLECSDKFAVMLGTTYEGEMFTGADHIRTVRLPKSNMESLNSIPKEFALKQCYPNPFNPSTTINYELPEEGFVNLVVYNLLGEQVTVLVNEQKNAGRYEVKFNATDLPSGIYLYKIRAGTFTDVKKMLLLK